MFQLKYKHPDFKDLFEEISGQDVNLFNPHMNMMEYFLKNPDKINWSLLSKNPSNCAIKIMHENINKIDMYELMSNQSHNIEPLLEKVIDKFTYSVWRNLVRSYNPYGMSFLSKHLGEIDYFAPKFFPSA